MIDKQGDGEINKYPKMKFITKILIFHCINASMIQNFFDEFTRERRCLAISTDASGLAILRAL